MQLSFQLVHKGQLCSTFSASGVFSSDTLFQHVSYGMLDGNFCPHFHSLLELEIL